MDPPKVGALKRPTEENPPGKQSTSKGMGKFMESPG
jgi:hypothetical protein